MLGGSSFQAVVDLPANLELLCDRLGLAPSGDEDSGEDIVAGIMRRHTMLPLYAPFQWPGGLAKVQAAMRGKGGPTMHCRLGIMAGRVRPPKWMRRCPLCDHESSTLHRELYWHRMHQVPGIELCPRHGVLLVACDRVRHDPPTRHAFLPAESSPVEILNPCSLDFAPATAQLLLRLGRGVAWLLQENRKWGCAAQVRALYRRLLAERDLISVGGSVRWEQMLNEFRSRYTVETLDFLQSATSRDDKRILWLERLLRSKRSAQSPIRHLLLMDFLGYDAESFFGLLGHDDETMFGKTGWPCLNPVCAQRGNFCIGNVHVKRGCNSPVRPVGLFHCNICGFTYARYGPDRERVRIAQIDWVVEYGERWTSVLRTMWDDLKSSLRAIARCLQVDPVTVKRMVIKLGLDPCVKSRCGATPGERRTGSGACVVIKRRLTHTAENAHREEWQAVLQTGLYSTRTEARRAHPSLYAWLYRHDRIWLQQQLLPVQSATPRNNVHRRTNAVWVLRDLEASAKVFGMANLLKNASGKPQRVSSASIARQLGIRAYIQKHPKKMPRTVLALRRCSEDRVTFAERRLMWAASKFVSLNAQIPRWRLIRIAGLRPEIARLGKIASMLDALGGASAPEFALKVVDG